MSEYPKKNGPDVVKAEQQGETTPRRYSSEDAGSVLTTSCGSSGLSSKLICPEHHVPGRHLHAKKL